MSTLDHLETAWRAWATTGAALTEEQWRTPTRLPGWTVADVYGHHGAFPHAIAATCAAPPVDRPLTHPDAAALLAAFNQPGGPAETFADRVRDGAVAEAAARTRAELVDTFARTGPDALALARTVEPDRRIDYAGVAVLTFGEALHIALMEAVVHHLDVAAALGLPVPGALGADPVRETAALLARVADPVAFVERATGRTDRDVLPVLR